MQDSAPSSKWAVISARDTTKRLIPPPTSDDYADWTLDQLKLECTARKLNVMKNTRKQERVKLLRAYDANTEGVEVLLRRQRKRSRRTSEEEPRRTSGCMFRLINVLFSLLFFDRFISLGNLLRRDELDEGGSTFWMDVATACCSDASDYDGLISDDAVFEGIDPSMHVAHSAEKLKRMRKEVASKFARAEANSKVFGQGSHDFWDFCDGNAAVYYLDRWCEHRQTGREFCAANIYPDDEDDSTQEGNGRQQKPNNRKRNKGAQEDTMTLLVKTIKEKIDSDTTKVQETWKEQKIFLQEQRAAQKLSTLSGMLARNAAEIQELLQRRREYHVQGLDAAEIGHALANCEKKKAMIDE
ncbi:hypothetical protein PF008_g13960 [Phytophthora fragariae]|uniref:SAP domain-containing protein n=1 Tax=Phytophthora fragariae TaxID=53985 RepID=A0A6G0RIC8_9STRA|nr:hypothetical protein PF008_g13960 [Phytophthora fragariae]